MMDTEKDIQGKKHSVVHRKEILKIIHLERVDKERILKMI